MSANRWQQILDLFAQAVECPVSERQQFLDRVCLEDESLKHELESLLANDAPAQPLIDIPADFVASCSDNGESDGDMAGRRIGPYRLIGLIGHGGMGAVYLGVRDDDQYQKQVAVKLLKRGMDTDFMLSRFRHERQILANLEHPFIARLIDGGATEDGLPYFVMEYVDGVPITGYCSDKNLSIPERLRLFRLVCEAVQYAHQNLVVHRDIKPGNILTTKEGIPKLLDFGIAKVLDPGIPSNVTFTRPELRMLTPDYASPEQIKGLPIGTASDIYSLGAVLYELLTGRRPHDFPSSSITEMERIICEVDPEKPSLAANKQVRRQLAGDLDNIILTAMRKEPQRRYTSVAELSEDLRRHMEALPILAHEDRWTYRAGKFVHRNKLAVGAALLVAASLIGGIVTTSIQARRAERRFQLVRQLANSVLYDLHDRVERLPGSMSTRVAMIQTVVQYLDNLAQDSGGDPTLDLEIAKSYARVASAEGHPRYSSLGRTVVALDHYQKALEIFERLSRRSETKAEALRNLAGTHIDMATVEEVLGHRLAMAEHMQKAATLALEIHSQGGSDLHPSTLVSLYTRLGNIEAARGDGTAELSNISKAAEICRRWAEGDPSSAALTSLRDTYSQLANAKAHAGDLYGARDTFRLAIKVAEQLQARADASDRQLYGLVGLRHVFGDLLGAPDDPNLGEPAEALIQFRAAAAFGEAFATKDPKDVNAWRNLAGSYRRVGLMLLPDDPSNALQFYRKAVAISSDLAASEPRNVHYRSALADGLLGVGQALHRLGRREEALQQLNRTLELQKSVEAAALEQLWLLRTSIRSHMAIGNVLLDQGHMDDALGSYRDGLAAAERWFGRFPSALHFALDRADLLEAMGAYYLARAFRLGVNSGRRTEWKAEARAFYQQSLDIWQDWNARKIGVPYGGRRMSRMVAMIASIDRS